MFIIGPNATCTPLPLNSAPIASPRARSSVRFHVDATVMPAGNAVTKSARRTPSGESSRQSPGHEFTAPMLPTQRPFSHPTPVTEVTLSSRDQRATSRCAFACAAAHAGPKSGMRSEPGGGGDLGDVEGNVPGMGDAEGTGKDENG